MGQFIILLEARRDGDSTHDPQVFDDLEALKRYCKDCHRSNPYWRPTVYEIQNDRLVNVSSEWGLRWYE